MVSDISPIARNWWLFGVLGLVSIAAGVLAIVYPDITLLALGLFIGISLLFLGIMEVVEAIAGDAESRALSAIVGVLTLLAGLVCLRRPGESLLAIVVVLGIYLILGVLILALPELSLVTLAVLFAISLILRGAFAVLVAFRLRKARHMEPPQTAAPGGVAPA
jgi:uncharacterized membrane protein HdeD (DUF308 family)